MNYTPFDYLKTINNKDGQLPIDNYNLFIINRGLSFNSQTILFANELNMNHHIPNNWAYDFLYFGIPKKKRYDKWIKREEVKDLDVIVEYYNISFTKALQYSKILSVEQIKELKRRLDKGGK
ncbi:MAG: DNA polymerase clamp loader subunit A [Bacilli bacterium]|nr:DNA polymerase clamp loader subunit A [Bacilli bacterium]